MATDSVITGKVLVQFNYPSTVIDFLEHVTDKQFNLLKKISVGPHVGQKFVPKVWIKIILPLAMALIDRYEVENVRLWYDRYDQQDHLAFDRGYAHYEIRYYRKFEIAKNHDDELIATKTYSDADEILLLFHHNKDKEWHVSLPGVDNMRIAERLIDQQRRAVDRFFQGFSGIFSPVLSETKGGYYIGTRSKKNLRWKMMIIVDPCGWKVVGVGQMEIARARYFASALQYALQKWDWLNDK